MKPSDWLEQHEWTQGVPVTYDNDGNVTGGCLIVALKETGASFDAQVAVQEVCQSRYGLYSIAQVNDEVLTTKAQAVALLREAGQ